jgi:hypothetical protein
VNKDNFTLYLFVRNSAHTALKDLMNEKDVVGKGCGPIQGIILAFAWRGSGKPQNVTQAIPCPGQDSKAAHP